MADYFQDMGRREPGEAPNTLRMARYLIDIGLFEDNFSGDWQRTGQYVEGWQWQDYFPSYLRTGQYVESWQWQDGQNEPMEPQPACQEAIKNLPSFIIQTEGKDCSICLMEFKKNDTVKSMPCQHMFHELCILTWLNQNNTCPFCRHRLPTGPN